MNRRGFLSQFIKGGITAIVAPQIITHGLGLIIPRSNKLGFYGMLEPGEIVIDIRAICHMVDGYRNVIEKEVSIETRIPIERLDEYDKNCGLWVYKGDTQNEIILSENPVTIKI